MFVHTPGEMANPSCTLFFPLSEEASQEVSCFVKLKSVLLSDTKRDLVEKLLQRTKLEHRPSKLSEVQDAAFDRH